MIEESEEVMSILDILKQRNINIDFFSMYPFNTSTADAADKNPESSDEPTSPHLIRQKQQIHNSEEQLTSSVSVEPSTVTKTNYS